MVDNLPRDPSGRERVQRHRSVMAAKGLRRLEIRVPDEDAALVKAVAEQLRKGGKRARKIRKALTPLVQPPMAKTGAELVAFLRASPLVALEAEAFHTFDDEKQEA